MAVKWSLSNEDWQFLTLGDADLGWLLDELASECQGGTVRTKTGMSGVEAVHAIALVSGEDPDPEEIRLFGLFDLLNLDQESMEKFLAARARKERDEPLPSGD